MWSYMRWLIPWCSRRDSTVEIHLEELISLHYRRKFREQRKVRSDKRKRFQESLDCPILLENFKLKQDFPSTGNGSRSSLTYWLIEKSLLKWIHFLKWIVIMIWRLRILPPMRQSRPPTVHDLIGICGNWGIAREPYIHKLNLNFKKANRINCPLFNSQ